MEKFLEIKTKEKELDQAKNALFDFEEGQKDVGSTEVTSTEVQNSEHSEHRPSVDDKNPSPEEEIISLNHNHSEQIRDILQQIDPTKSNQTGIEIEFELKVPENNDSTITHEKNIENNTPGTELVLELNGIKQEGEIASAKPTREKNMKNKTLAQKLNLIKQKEQEIASAKSSILTELEVQQPSDNVSHPTEVKLADEKGDARELVEKIKDIQDKEIELKEAKTLLFNEDGKSDQDNASGICYSWTGNIKCEIMANLFLPFIDFCFVEQER